MNIKYIQTGSNTRRTSPISLKKAYLKLASENPNRIHVIDASKTKNQIKLNIFKIVDKYIENIKKI